MGWFLVIAVMLVLMLWMYRRLQHMARADYIRQYVFPAGLLDKLSTHLPQLEAKDRQLIARALRQFFLAYLKSGRKSVAMPSQAVDALWHEFILYTRHYQYFCDKAFGRFLHHTPAIVLGAERQDNLALRRVWWYACREENINPRKASRLPLLFAIDSKLNIANGFVYRLNCQRHDRNAGGDYCASDFADSSCDGFFGSDFSSDGGCSGGDGCSGGCGGGD